MEISNLKEIEQKIRYKVRPLAEVRAKAEEYQIIYGTYSNKKTKKVEEKSEGKK